jgi:SSS family transporter
MTSHLRLPDLAIVALYLIGITLFGLHFREKSTTPGAPSSSRSLKSYFLANNTIPWWAIALSIVSAETSTLTIISIPGVAFAGDFGFLQVVLGYMLGRIVVALLFLPRYFAGEMLTAYQLIDQRFGHALHKVTAGLFLLTRAAAEGVRVFAVSIVVGIAIGTRDVLSIAIISALTLLYTFEGGLAAVIWTDVVQMAIYVAGTLVAIWSLGHHIGADRSAIAGWAQIHTVASAAGKFHLFTFALNLTTTYTFWAGVLGGTFLTMASHGTDQLMVQRMLAARSLRESQLALLSSGVVIFIQFALFLLIGVGLYVFAQQATIAAIKPGAPFMTGLHPVMGGVTASGAATAPGSWIKGLAPDRIFPTFIVREMPLGIAGLLVAAILAAAMSNLSAALNSLSSTTVVDFYMHLRPNADDRERNLIAKSSTVLWALVLFAIAVYSLRAGGKGHVVEIGLSIASVAYGCLLGVFLLGTLTKFATQTGASIGMLCGFIVNLYLWQGSFPKLIWPTVYDTPRHGPNGTVVSNVLFTGLTIPHIAWTWYVLIGAIVTFAIGSLFSLIFRKQSRRAVTVAAASLLLLFFLSFPQGICFSAQAQSRAPHLRDGLIVAKVGIGEADPSTSPNPATTPDFTPISTLINDAIAAHKLPGAVALIGHNNEVVFEHAYGDRKLAGEPGPIPGPDGKPDLRPEPMTEDTIFDMASLSKCLSTATAIMQLYEAGKITSFDDPVEQYLPAFNATHDATRAKVTLRMLLTHTSGEAPDVDLKTPWGLSSPDKAEGIRLALTTPLKSTPGDHFEYSDINFILLGDLVETLSGQPLDVYAQQHIFKPLGMTDTRYLPLAKACGPHHDNGAAIAWAPAPRGRELFACPQGDWSTSLLPRIAPETHDDEGNAQTNPDFDHLLRGTVHDPTTRRMGGVAGHAGVFSTAHDVYLFANALLEKLLHNTGSFPLKQSTLQLMTMPEQPNSSTPGDPSSATASASPKVGLGKAELAAANSFEAASIAAGDKPAEPGLAPHYPALHGQNLRGFGWDIDTAFSKPRGLIFPIGSFGHTGYTGTSLWMDPASDTYVILLANAVHPHDQHRPISNLRGEVATAAAQALGLGANRPVDCKQPNVFCDPTKMPKETGAPSSPTASSSAKVGIGEADLSRTSTQPRLMRVATSRYPEASASGLMPRGKTGALVPEGRTLTGIDVMEQTHFAALHGLHHLGLLTNQTGIDAEGHRTVDILHSLPSSLYSLLTVFSPEHGINGILDQSNIASTTDPATHLPVISLYGAHPSDRHPTHAQLANLDAVVIDLQDVGVRFWTYEAATTYFLEAAAREQTDFHHPMEIVLLDRPNPIGGVAIQGPVSDPGLASYVNSMPIPVRHGLTLGELARYFVGTHHLATHLTVIPMQHWSRTEYFADTHLPWVNPSPNLRSPEAAILYPALGLIETTNLSVGRGTPHPFSFFGAGVSTPSSSPTLKEPVSSPSTSPALKGTGFSPSVNDLGKPGALGPEGPWFNAATVAAAITARHLPGVIFTATTVPIAEDANHYPFHGQTIPAVRLSVTDPTTFNSPETGIEILTTLHRLYPTQFRLVKVQTLLCNQATLDALEHGDDPRAVALSWQPQLKSFKLAINPYLLYP